MPDEGMRTFPEVMESLVDLQQGRPEAAHAILETLGLDTDDERPARVRPTVRRARAWRVLQLGRSTKRSTCSPAATRGREDDGPRMSIGCRLALAYAAAADDRRRRPRSSPSSKQRAGGTFSDRMSRAVGRRFVRTQRRRPDAREPVDAAYDIAIGTDAPLEHAIAALRARQGARRARHRRCRATPPTSAPCQLEALGLTADGWLAVFDLALAERQCALVDRPAAARS